MNIVAPLTKFQRFATDDLEVMRGAMTDAYCRHDIRTNERRPRLRPATIRPTWVPSPSTS